MADQLMHINTLTLAAGAALEIAVLVRVILRPHCAAEPAPFAVDCMGATGPTVHLSAMPEMFAALNLRRPA